MMIKHFCDVCGKEITRNMVSERFNENCILRNKRVQVEIVIGVGSTWNAGDLCRGCLWEFLDIYDSRPKAAEAAILDKP
jgi:hypothetical protein